MRYRLFSPLSVSTAALLLAVGCAEREPTAATLTTTEGIELSVHAGNPVVLSAMGSGHATFAGDRRTFAFTALQRAGDVGSAASGEIQVKNRGADNGFHARVICMARLYGGLVGIGAVTTKRHGVSAGFPGFPPAPPTDQPAGILLAVRDNGEGAGADPDQITGAVVTAVFMPQIVCNNPAAFFPPGALDPFLIAVEQGGIQVNP